MTSWSTKSFSELSNEELFESLKLRQSVFVVEQECAYPDIDACDKVAMHLLGHKGNELIAYARLLKPGVSYEYSSIGRVAVAPNARGSQIGRELMEVAISETERLYPDSPIKIGAQERLEGFYLSLGFVRTSDMYVEDGIPHIEMLREFSGL